MFSVFKTILILCGITTNEGHRYVVTSVSIAKISAKIEHKVEYYFQVSFCCLIINSRLGSNTVSTK